MLCKSKNEGGAGLRRATDMNKALLAKLAWRILNGEEETWCKVMRCKYGVTDNHPDHEAQTKGVQCLEGSCLGIRAVTEKATVEGQQWEEGKVLG